MLNVLSLYCLHTIFNEYEPYRFVVKLYRKYITIDIDKRVKKRRLKK
jgi:hypothetical protein